MSKARAIPMTQDELDALFIYNPETGELKWQSTGKGRKRDCMAGTLRTHGYLALCIKYRQYLNHRIIYKMVRGIDPECIDHIDCNKLNNRIDNLRACTHAQAQQNKKMSPQNTSGIKGVSFYKRDGTWVAQITVNRKAIYLGRFDDIQDAAAAYAAGSKKYHGEFGRVE